MVAVSVVVATTDPGPGLLGLVRSVDAQTLPSSEFELVIADASTDGSADRLRELAGRRPNVVLVTAGTGTAQPELLAMARQHASGDRLLVLAQDRRLAPRALELLLARARASGSDVVLGRVVSGAGSGSAQVPIDADRIDGAAIDPRTSVALVPRDAEDLSDLAGLTVAVESRYAGAVGDGEADAPASTRDAAIGSAAIRWEAGRLRVDAEVRGAPPGCRAWLVAAQETIDVAEPATLTGDGAFAAALDPRTAEAGHPLGDGLWDLRLRLVWSAGETTLPLPAGPTTLAAVVEGRPSVVRAGERGALLDAGATLGGVSGAAPQTTASVVESVHGILLTLDQPALHVHGDAELGARLLLDGFVLRGRLVCRDGAARVEALVSSLAGASRIALVVGGGKPVPTGLRLVVDGLGAMTVETVPAPGTEGLPPLAGRRPLVQRVRRLAPPALEPVVHRLARVPALRRVYRVLLSR